MPAIQSLHLYPIKSCAGIALSRATLTINGLATDGVHDREWMLVNTHGLFLTQRDRPRMALIRPTIEEDALRVEAPGMPPLRLTLAFDTEMPRRNVTVWEDNLEAYDCGNEAAAWFSGFLEMDCRLVRSHQSIARACNQKWTGEFVATKLFADGYPILLIGQSSLDDVNRKMQAQGRSALPVDRFRPNVVVSDLDAYEEDYVAHFSSGSTKLKPIKPCPRCPIPSIDQATGIPGPNPLDILQSYRANALLDGAVTLGMNVIVTSGMGNGLVVGDELEVELNF